MTQRTINLYDGLEALYFMESDYFDSGTNEMKDHSGHGRHAVASGGPSVGAGQYRDFGATSFDGSDDYFTTPFRDDDSSFTISVLVKATQNTERRYIVSAQDGFDNGYYISTGPSGDVRFGILSASKQEENTVYTIYDRWSLLTMRYDGSTWTCFGDNELLINRTADFVAPNTDLTIGRLAYSNLDHWLGEMSFVGVWDRDLSDAEIAQLNRMTAPMKTLR